MDRAANRKDDAIAWPEDMELRAMQRADLDEVMLLEARAYSHPWSEGNFQDCLNSAHECWVLRFDDQHIGHAVLSAAAGESHLLNISVHPDFRRQGLGRNLLRHMLGRARGLGAEATFLEVRASNRGAYRLYESEGFNELACRKNYYPAGSQREDALILAIDL